MPLVDGDLWFECRMLMEACRFYDIDRVAKLVTDKSGFGALRAKPRAAKARYNPQHAAAHHSTTP